MFDSIANLMSISLRLIKSNQFNQTTQLTPGQDANNKPSLYIVKRHRLQRLFLYKILNAVHIFIHKQKIKSNWSSKIHFRAIYL